MRLLERTRPCNGWWGAVHVETAYNPTIEYWTSNRGFCAVTVLGLAKGSKALCPMVAVTMQVQPHYLGFTKLFSS